MSRFKPQVSWVDKYYKTQRKRFDTFRELKKALPEICKENKEFDGVFVVRSRRGEWGEWFEYWDLDMNDKLYVRKQGWM